jgi:hypothetical protein
MVFANSECYGCFFEKYGKKGSYMKIICILLMVCFISSGCNQTHAERERAIPESNRFIMERHKTNHWSLWLITDKETGKQYLQTFEGGLCEI